MAWTLGGVRIYTQDYNQSDKQIVARLQPLSGGTVKQVFGYETDIYKITAKIVGNTARDSLDGFCKDGTTHSLVGPEETVGSFYLLAISFKRDPTYYQTIDTDQSCTTPVYTVEMELG